jgi:hypothetical protein
VRHLACAARGDGEETPRARRRRRRGRTRRANFVILRARGERQGEAYAVRGGGAGRTGSDVVRGCVFLFLRVVVSGLKEQRWSAWKNDITSTGRGGAASSVARVEAKTSRAHRAAARVPTRRARGREEHALSGYAPSDGHVPSAHAVASARPSAHRVSASASALAAMPREPPSARRVLPRAIEPAKRGTGGSCARREGVGRRRRSWMQTTPCFWRRGVSVVVCAHTISDWACVRVQLYETENHTECSYLRYGGKNA